MIIQVSYYCIGEHHLSHESFATIADAVAFVRAVAVPGNNIGLWPSMLYNDGSIIWRAALCQDRMKPGARPFWSMTFPPAGIYKSLACRIGEGAGVRYASHRVGYRASERAFGKFIVEIGELIARVPLAA